MANKPLEHDAVRLLRHVLEQRVATARHDNQFGGSQFAAQPDTGAQTDSLVAVAPYQQNGYALDPAKTSPEPSHISEPAAKNGENVPQIPGIP